MSDDKQQSFHVTAEQLLKRTNNLYEAIVAISKEARRVNLISQTLDAKQKPVTKALLNFVEGKVAYFTEAKNDSTQATKRLGKKRGSRVK